MASEGSKDQDDSEEGNKDQDDLKRQKVIDSDNNTMISKYQQEGKDRRLHRKDNKDNR